MKKNLLTTAILLVALVAQAQNSVKIAPVLKVGMEKTYITKGEANTPGSAAADITGEVFYKVVSKTFDGYQINMKSKTNKIDATQMMQTLSSPDIMQLLNSMNIELLTDKNGGPTGIKNVKELSEKCGTLVDSMFNAVLNQSPEMKNNEMLKTTMQKTTATMKDMFTDEYMFEAISQTPGVTALNGKTITEGMVEDGTYAQFLKTKTTYTLLNGGKTIVQNTKADVDKESMKAYMLKIMNSLLPESVAKETNPEQLSNMIEEMITNGTLKMDMSRKTTYDIGDDGWVKKLVMEMDMNMPNQTAKVRQVIALKD